MNLELRLSDIRWKLDGEFSRSTIMGVGAIALFFAASGLGLDRYFDHGLILSKVLYIFAAGWVLALPYVLLRRRELKNERASLIDLLETDRNELNCEI